MTTLAPAALHYSPPSTDRGLLTGVFAAVGVGMAVWGARMPAVRDAAHLSTGQLSVVLLSAAAGIVAGLQIGGRLADRHGPSHLLIAPTVLFGLALALVGQCRTLLTLVLAAAVFGLAHGLLDVGANASAVNCETSYRRPIMAGLHCAFSLGALGGATLAAVTAGIRHSLLFAIVGVIIALAALMAMPRVRAATSLNASPTTVDFTDESTPALSPRSTIWLLGALAAACLLGEGAAADWSAIQLRSLDAGEAMAAAAYALYSASMAAGRLFGDRLTRQYGAPAVVCTGAVVAATGFGAGVASGTASGALLGWMALGVGLSAVMPSLMHAAGRGGPRAVGTVAATGYVGLLAGPAAIGALASVASLSAALALPAVLAVAVAFLSHRALQSR